ncbi:MAG: ABC transporter permease [Chloroflexi bacterium]|nr:ABC transporter permease [Chloroflexota bacterium]
MLDEIFRTTVLASAIRLATPYIFASMGETFSQRSGVLNLGVEGIMLLGAFASYYTVLETGSLVLGLLAAIGTGLLMGLVTAFVSVTLKAEQGISGIGIYLFGLGLSEMLFKRLVGTPTHVKGFPKVDIPVLTDLPVLGEVLFNHNIMIYLAFLTVPLSACILNRTTLGLQIRAVGQTPEAADAMGISVARVRYFTVTLGGVMSSLAGASLSIALVNFFQGNLTAGQGFIAVALVYFGAWRPYWVMAGAMLFSTVNALQLQIKTIESALSFDIPDEFAVMAPYVVTILTLIIASQRVEQPTALTKPFERGE